MKITTVQLKHSNPSMGPHETIVTFDMSNNSTHEEVFEQLLKESTINKQFSLEEFLKAHVKKDKATIQEILKAYEPGKLASGGTISGFSMLLENGVEVHIRDLRTTLLGGYYSTFIPYLVKHGFRKEYSGWELSPKIKNPSLKLPNDPEISNEEEGHSVSDY